MSIHNTQRSDNISFYVLHIMQNLFGNLEK